MKTNEINVLENDVNIHSVVPEQSPMGEEGLKDSKPLLNSVTSDIPNSSKEDSLNQDVRFSRVPSLLEVNIDDSSKDNDSDVENNPIREISAINVEKTQNPFVTENGQFLDDWLKQCPQLEPYSKTLKKFKTPEALARSYAELEKMKGYPSDVSDEKQMSKFRKLMGLPDTGEDFVLEIPDDLPEELRPSCWDESLVQKLSETAYQYGVPPVAMKALVSTFVKEQKEMYLTQQEWEQTEEERSYEQGMSVLKECWGRQYHENLGKASQAVRQLCSELDLDTKTVLEDKALKSDPVFIRLMNRVGEVLAEPAMKGGELCCSEGTLEAQRMATDSHHPLHQAYMDYTHPDHKLANKRYDELMRQ